MTNSTGEVLDLILQSLEEIEHRVAAPQIVLNERQQALMGNLFLARYAIEGGVPVPMSLKLAGFDVAASLLENDASQPAPSEGFQGQVAELVEIVRSLLASLDVLLSRGNEVSADTLALREILQGARALMEDTVARTHPGEAIDG
jgi:hypothetical protein